MHYTLAFLLAFSISALTGSSYVEAASITGSWSGGGIVKLKTGQTERVRCRVRYSKGSGKTFALSATCASTAGTIKQSGRVVRIGGGNRYRGRLYNPEYSVSGRISVSVKGRRQTVILSSSKGTGRLTLRKR